MGPAGNDLDNEIVAVEVELKVFELEPSAGVELKGMGLESSSLLPWDGVQGFEASDASLMVLHSVKYETRAS